MTSKQSDGGHAERLQLGEKTDVDAVSGLVDLKGLRIIDVGCGPGTAARQLCELGASVLGVEPDPIQAQKNREANPVADLTLLEGGAENLPAENASVDGVFFFRSLHHVPGNLMDAALAEARRVLKPETGFLCIVEPGMTGTHFKVMRPFHDETQVRTEAQAALRRTATHLFQTEELFEYMQYPRYANFDALVTRVTGQTFNNIQREVVETAEVRALFEECQSKDGDYVLEQPLLVNLYRQPIQQ